MIGPFPVSAVIDRLRAEVPDARLIGTAADLRTAVESQPNASPALYVLVSERGGEIKYSGPPTLQNVDVQITVVLLVRHAGGETTGRGARATADGVIAQIRRALLGWAPQDGFAGLSFNAGRDDSYRAGWYAGQEIYTTQYRMQNP